MAGFLNLPHVRGDTDDDASIHLHSHVGPARPMPRRNYDRQIMDILRKRPANDFEDIGLDLEELNRKFEKFATQAEAWSDSEGDETQVEDVPPRRKASTTSRKASKSQRALISFWNPNVLPFLIAFLIFALTPLPKLLFSNNESSFVAPDLLEVRSRIDSVEQRVTSLNEVTKALDQQVDLVGSKQNTWISTMTDKIASFELQLHGYEHSFSIGQQQLDQVQKEIKACEAQISGLELITDDSESLHKRLAFVSQKMAELSKINTDIGLAKSEIIDSLILKLPEHVPVYIKNKKIHYLPEFHKFIYSFVEKIRNGEGLGFDWKVFLKENGSSLEKYVQNVIKDSSVQFMTRENFEGALKDVLETNNADLMYRFNSLIDKVDLHKNITKFDLSHTTNKIVLENLLELVSKGSIKINYADFKLGSRILGFLTTTSFPELQRKSFLRKALFGWYDYLSSNGLRAPKNLKYNANNILLDGGLYWECEGSRCSVGVRLSSPVILTDLVLKNPSAQKPDHIGLPAHISIYVKPRKKQHASALGEFLSKYKPGFLLNGNNKYLTKFYKVQEARFAEPGVIEHVKLPVSIVNMKIPVRDIYLEVSSDSDKPVGLFNVKAYGLTEFNAIKYGEEFDSILDVLAEDTPDDVYNSRSHDYGAPVLGDDEFFI